ncbi:MAG: hypothetical protein JKY43_04835 [Phycisphaerales bacterium]|nr:hypothetical protein [Phycisphaerales bacterium]
MTKLYVFFLVLLTTSVLADIRIIAEGVEPDQVVELERVVEEVGDQFFDLIGIENDSDSGKAAISLHINYSDYELADERLNAGRFKNNWAFSHPAAMESHVALQPPVSMEVLEQVGLPLQTKIQIAHESVHLYFYKAFPNHPSHPDWLSEGVAVYVAERSIRSLGAMGPAEAEPWTSTEIVRVQKMFKNYPEMTIDSILAGSIEDVSSLTMYALHGLFIGWLDEIGAAEKILQEARRFGGGSKYAQNLSSAVVEAIESAGIDDPDATFRAWVNGFEPQWEEVYRSMQTSNDEWMHAAFASKNAICWNQEPLGEGDWAITGSLYVFNTGRSQMNILLGRSTDGFVTVACSGDWGVTIFNYTSKDNNWNRLEVVEVPTMKFGRWIKFKISKRGNRLWVRMGKQRAFKVEIGDLDLSGQWGLGVQKGSAGIWKDVQVDR